MTHAPADDIDALRRRIEERVQEAAAARARLVCLQRAALESREEGLARQLASRSL